MIEITYTNVHTNITRTARFRNIDIADRFVRHIYCDAFRWAAIRNGVSLSYYEDERGLEYGGLAA
jgi:hypothetical protein